MDKIRNEQIQHHSGLYTEHDITANADWKRVLHRGLHTIPTQWIAYTFDDDGATWTRIPALLVSPWVNIRYIIEAKYGIHGKQAMQNPYFHPSVFIQDGSHAYRKRCAKEASDYLEFFWIIRCNAWEVASNYQATVEHVETRRDEIVNSWGKIKRGFHTMCQDGWLKSIAARDEENMPMYAFSHIYVRRRNCIANRQIYIPRAFRLAETHLNDVLENLKVQLSGMKIGDTKLTQQLQRCNHEVQRWSEIWKRVFHPNDFEQGRATSNGEIRILPPFRYQCKKCGWYGDHVTEECYRRK
jgi:hypothetical protein